MSRIMKQGQPRWKALILAPPLFFVLSTAMAYEEPRYAVLEENDSFEIRQYETQLIAMVQVRDDFKEAGNQAFRVLFDYISGQNTRQKKIAMTVPVNQQPVLEDGEKIQMTVPVLQAPGSEADSGYEFSFVMPANYSVDTLPLPKDSRITIKQVPAKLMAARRYSGSWSEKNYRKNETILLEALREREIKTEGTPIYARYNSPFSLWFMRRNEVLVELSR